MLDEKTTEVEMSEEIAELAEAVLSNEALTDWENRIGLSLRINNIFNRTVYVPGVCYGFIWQDAW